MILLNTKVARCFDEHLYFKLYLWIPILFTIGLFTLINEPGRLTFLRFGISICNQYSIFRYTFQFYCSRIFKTFSTQIHYGFQIWKIYIQSFQINSLILRIVNEHDSSFLIPWSEHLPRSIDCNDGRSISIISLKFIQYFRLLLIMINGMYNPRV